MTETVQFIAMINPIAAIAMLSGSGSKRTLVEKHGHHGEIWLPTRLHSHRPRGSSKIVTNERPLANYIFCNVSHQGVHAIKSDQDTLGGLIFINHHRQEESILKYREDVTSKLFEDKEMAERNLRQFHHNFKRGQSLRLKNRLFEMLKVEFEGVNNMGRAVVKTDFVPQMVVDLQDLEAAE